MTSLKSSKFCEPNTKVPQRNKRNMWCVNCFLHLACFYGGMSGSGFWEKLIQCVEDLFVLSLFQAASKCGGFIKPYCIRSGSKTKKIQLQQHLLCLVSRFAFSRCVTLRLFRFEKVFFSKSLNLIKYVTWMSRRAEKRDMELDD